MSLDSSERGAGVGGSAGASERAPRLQGGGDYAAWRPRMDAFLQAKGAEGIHRKAMTQADWRTMEARVELWSDEALAHALVETSSSSGSGSGSAAVKAEPLSAETKAARALVCATVARSQRAYGMLYTALPAELQLQVAHLPQGFAYGLWSWLEGKFQSTEDDNISALLQDWASLTQEAGESFDAYRARVNRLATLLERAEEKPSARVYAFSLLDKLQPQFKPAVLALKNGTLLKDIKNVDWEAVTRFVNAHERSEQRLDGAGTEGQPSAMAATQSFRRNGGASNKGAGDGWQQQKSRRRSHSRGSGESSAGERSGGCGGGGASGSRKIKCYECGKLGNHIARDCPERGGASQRESRSNEGEEQANAAHGWSDADGSDSDEEPRGRAYAVTEVKRTRTLTWADRFKETCEAKERAMAAATAKEKPAAAPKEAKKPTVTAGAAAPKRKEKQQAGVGGSLSDALRTGTWGLDTMASIHVSGNKSAFGTLHKAPEIQIKVADGGIVSAMQCGSVPLRLTTDGDKACKVELDSVYFNERFDANLLSWGRLYHQGWELHSSKSKGSFLLSPKGHKFPVSMRGKVMTLSTDTLERVMGALQAEERAMGKLMKVHVRLAHMGVDRLIRLLRRRTIDGLPAMTPQEIDDGREEVLACSACAKMKSRRADFGHRGMHRGDRAGEVLHLDTFFIQRSEDGQQWTEYGVTMSDAHGDYKWFDAALRKSEIPAMVLNMLRHARTQLECRIKHVYVDGGGEFINAQVLEECKRNGVELHWPPKGTPQLNSIAERWGQTLKLMGLTMMEFGHVPQRWWSYAMAHATFVWNRSHVAKATGCTPMETMRGQKPSAGMWGVFGCDVWLHVPKQQRAGTFGARAEPGIYLGHDSLRNCARVWSVTQRKMVATRDVKYRYNSFVNVSAMRSGNDAQQEAAQAEPSVVDDDIQQGAPAEEKEYAVEKITDQRVWRGKTQYKVHWVGYEDATWQPLEDVADTEALERYEAQRAQERAAEAPAPEAPAQQEAPRRSPRLVERDAAAAAASDGDDDAEPQAHMVMSTIRRLREHQA